MCNTVKRYPHAYNIHRFYTCTCRRFELYRSTLERIGRSYEFLHCSLALLAAMFDFDELDDAEEQPSIVCLGIQSVQGLCPWREPLKGTSCFGEESDTEFHLGCSISRAGSRREASFIRSTLFQKPLRTTLQAPDSATGDCTVFGALLTSS